MSSGGGGAESSSNSNGIRSSRARGQKRGRNGIQKRDRNGTGHSSADGSTSSSSSTSSGVGSCRTRASARDGGNHPSSNTRVFFCTDEDVALISLENAIDSFSTYLRVFLFLIFQTQSTRLSPTKCNYLDTNHAEQNKKRRDCEQKTGRVGEVPFGCFWFVSGCWVELFFKCVHLSVT